jgi:hypothetical protein
LKLPSDLTDAVPHTQNVAKELRPIFYPWENEVGKYLGEKSGVDVAPFEEIIRGPVVRMQNSGVMEESESMTVANESYTEIQILRVGCLVAVLLEDVTADESSNITDFGVRS